MGRQQDKDREKEMCGICGMLRFKDSIPDPALIQGMCRTLIHRGPDDEGIYVAPHIGLGQRRLSIIDLTPGACPPLGNEDKTIWLVFNGEIYNFRELRRELEQDGHLFRTETDTEVLIHLYEKTGTGCLEHLRGMFAFALWDAPRGQLFCARDRLGKKPLCYAITPDSLVFGSEIKAITADPEISVEPNYRALDLYLTYQFVPSPATAFEGIFRLGPGEFLTCDLKGNLRKQRYWEPPDGPKATFSPFEFEQGIVERLRKAVKRRLISDVPLGAFLSGGVDSAAIVALMAQESRRPVKTYSIGFEQGPFNELPYARMVARRFGTDHHEMMVRPHPEEMLPILVHHYNEPFADSSAIPAYCVSELTRRHVTVALTGDGGDESFAGYENYADIMSWGRWDRWPLSLRRAASQAGRAFLDLWRWSNQAARLRRGLAMVGAGNVKERRLQYGTILKPEEKRLAYTPKFRALISTPRVLEDPLSEYRWREGMDELDWLMRHDQNFYLPDCLMVKTDIASMANGLEVRCPFLDHELVEYAATIPSHLKRDKTGGKIILKRAVRDLLPAEILNKPKTGFAVPLSHWLRHDYAALLKGLLLGEVTARRDLFEPRLLKKMVNEHLDGRRDWSGRLWAFLFLESWFQEFID